MRRITALKTTIATIHGDLRFDDLNFEMEKNNKKTKTKLTGKNRIMFFS